MGSPVHHSELDSIKEMQSTHTFSPLTQAVPWLRPRFDPRTVSVGSVVDRVALGLVFLRVLVFSPSVSIFIPEQTMKDQMGEKRQSSTLSLTSALDGGGWLTPLYPREKTRHPLYRRLGAPVWTDAENFAPTGIRSSHRPAHSESLYLLRYPRQYYSSNIPHAYFILPPSTPHNLI